MDLVDWQTRPDRSDDIWFRHVDGRVFRVPSEAVRGYSSVLDAEGERVLLAGNRLWAANRGVFAEQERVGTRASGDGEEIVSAAGFSAQLTVRDRERLRAIVRRHHAFWFAGQPTNAQLDQFIDAMGPLVAARQVKRAVDRGGID